MHAAEFTATSIALLRSAVGWQSAIARRLGVESRTVRRWLRAGETPSWVDERFAEWIGPRPEPDWPRDEWLVGDGAGTGREYIAHLVPPRFVARVVVCDDAGHPEPGEMPADVLSGTVYAADENTVLCEIVWIDEVKPGQMVGLLEAAADALDRA